MGFRSTWAVAHHNVKWPDWFVEKYKNFIWFHEDHTNMIAPKGEGKCTFHWVDLVEDIQKCIDWADWYMSDHAFNMVFLHECSGITRVKIYKDRIIFSEPDRFIETRGFCHSDGCEVCYDNNDTELHPERRYRTRKSNDGQTKDTRSQ